MRTAIENKARTQWQLLLGVLTIVLVLAIPIPFAEITTEESPDDSNALQLTKDSPVELTIDKVPDGTKAIAIWTGDTLRAPYESELIIRASNAPIIRTTLGSVLGLERKITIPIKANYTQPLTVKITAPSLDTKTAIMLRTQQKNTTELAYTLFVRKPLIGALVKTMYSQKSTANDIQYVWQEGLKITNGENPYSRAASDTQDGSKYATYFPLSYIISAGIQKIGFTTFDQWLIVIRPIILGSQCICAALVFYYLVRKKQLALGIFAFFVILLHRFVLYPARVTHIDFPAIAFLLAGILLLFKKPKSAYLLMGTSLAIKQMAIFLLPVVLIYVWHKNHSKKQLGIAIFCLLLIPALSLLPFLYDSPLGTMQSIFYSVHRASTGDFASPDIATTLSLDGMLARLPMFGMLALAYIAAWRKEIHIFGASLAIFVVFVGFNPVLFFQYLAWIIPFVPLAISEVTLSGSPLQLFHQQHDT